MMVVIMCAYGLASMAGNEVNGRLVDRFSPVRVLTVVLAALFVNSLFGAFAFAVAAPAALGDLSLVWILLAGVGNGEHAVPQQTRLELMAPASVAVDMALIASAVCIPGARWGSV